VLLTWLNLLAIPAVSGILKKQGKLRARQLSDFVRLMYFDAHLLATSEAPAFPQQMGGAILFGAHAAPEQFSSAKPIFQAAIQTNLTQINDSAPVLDLQLPPGELLARLKRPKSEWFPLLESVRLKRQFLRLDLPPGASTVVGSRKLAEYFPHARFFIDPFQHGLNGGWQAHVRLAECENIWLTTFGLVPGPLCRWPEMSDVAEALHFTMGEVGASKLLFGSGHFWSSAEFSASNPQKWLEDVKSLDVDQLALILRLNARDLFGIPCE
jgi:hypothetical protein